MVSATNDKPAAKTSAATFTTTGTRITWTCRDCGAPISAKGWVELTPDQYQKAFELEAAWRAFDREHDGAGAFSLADMPDLPEGIWTAVCPEHSRDDGGYCIQAARISTIADMLHWSAHLAGKTWTDSTDWHDLCRRVAESAGARP